jgi:hypothetical protein
VAVLTYFAVTENPRQIEGLDPPPGEDRRKINAAMVFSPMIRRTRILSQVLLLIPTLICALAAVDALSNQHWAAIIIRLTCLAALIAL